MITLTFPDLELFDESTNTFSYVKGQTVSLEHSLVSISKWESRWKVPFISKNEMTPAQVKDYIKCMTITQNVNPAMYDNITQQMVDRIMKYIDDPMTATWFGDKKDNRQRQNGRPVTSELIYYWMIEAGIPMECQKWHLNRLLTLIEVVSEERKANDPNNKHKVNPRDFARSRSALNAARRAKMHSRG